MRIAAAMGLTLLIAGMVLAAEPPRSDQSAVQQLLEMSAPVASWQDAVGFPGPISLVAARANLRAMVPADDAALDVLMAYWGSSEVYRFRLPDGRHVLTPSEKVRARLQEAVIQRPQRWFAVGCWFTPTTETCDRMKSVFDKLPPLPGTEARLRDSLHDWLMTSSRYFRDDLLRAAQGLTDNGDYMVGDEAAEGLARLDWSAAEPLLKKKAEESEPHVATFALGQLYRHYARAGEAVAAESFRTRLRAVVEDRKALPLARVSALEAITELPWDKRDQWFLSLFGDPTLVDCSENGRLYKGPVYYTERFDPLAEVVKRDADYWIPLVAGLLAGKNQTVRDNAVTCLLQFRDEDVRKDALKPLLPWLTDPEWSSTRGGLESLIRRLAQLDLPESVSGLLWVLRNRSGSERAVAVAALTHYQAKEAGPDLKEVFKKTGCYDQGYSLVEAMAACGALSDQEMARSVEACARAMASDSKWAQGDAPDYSKFSSEAYMGQILPRSEMDREPLAELLVARAEALQATEPKVAEALSEILSRSRAAAVDRYIVARLKKSVEKQFILEALWHSRRMGKNEAKEWSELVSAGGERAGVAAAILGDGAVARGLIQGQDRPAQLMMLACARLIRAKLPVADLAGLLKQDDSLLAFGVERYLESEDSAEARRIILARHPGEAKILGESGRVYHWFDKDEEALRKEVLRPDGPEEIIALSSGGGMAQHWRWIIRIKGHQRRLSLERREDKAESRELTVEELKSLRELLSVEKFEDMPRLDDTGVMDGTEYEYLHLTRDGGRRVYMNNPGTAYGTVASAYDLVVRRFGDLCDTGQFQAEGEKR